uniref:CARD domain-containing protein n=1 Tax=Molossus molossus TaxID=27622 RepID=A0A7J8EQY0_MOLMO|nr:hypothetical protein HJG59_008628 [Molossus molossus]
MAEKRQKEDPINMVKSFAKNVIDGIIDDLTEKNVLNRDELQKIGEGVGIIVKRTESLLDDFTEKTQMTGEILMDNLFNKTKLLSLKSHSENENDESGNSDSSSLTGNCLQISHHRRKLLTWSECILVQC